MLSRLKLHLRNMRDCLLWNFAKVILFWTLADAQVRHWVYTGVSWQFFSLTVKNVKHWNNLIVHTAAAYTCLRRVLCYFMRIPFRVFMVHDNERNFIKANYLPKTCQCLISTSAFYHTLYLNTLSTLYVCIHVCMGISLLILILDLSLLYICFFNMCVFYISFKIQV